MSDSDVVVRMYDVGFGDCFLVLLPGADKRVVLIDAGFHSQGKGAFSGKELATRVIKDVKEFRGSARIDVVIATHRHQDHVYAFNAPEWDAVEIGEVWMPWVEDRGNAVALKLWKKKSAFAEQLAATLPSMALDRRSRSEVEFLLWNAGVGEPMFAGWSNLGALDRLYDGFAKRDVALPRFLPQTSNVPETFETTSLPGVRIHVLGPPRNPEQLSKGDPERDGQTYRALALLQAEASNRPIDLPFRPVWRAPEDASGGLKRDEVARLEGLARAVDPLFAAAALDDMINATSLVLVLQVGKARLLLPGDAEWGTWKLILANDRAKALIKGTTFLKVGHHGSHNGTPKSLVEAVLRRGTKAMVSTQQGPGSYRNDIPLPQLLKALKAQGVEAVRSDLVGKRLPKGFSKDAGGDVLELRLPT